MDKLAGPEIGTNFLFLSKLLKRPSTQLARISLPESVYPPEAETDWSSLKTAELPYTRFFV